MRRLRSSPAARSLVGALTSSAARPRAASGGAPEHQPPAKAGGELLPLGGQAHGLPPRSEGRSGRSRSGVRETHRHIELGCLPRGEPAPRPGGDRRHLAGARAAGVLVELHARGAAITHPGHEEPEGMAFEHLAGAHGEPGLGAADPLRAARRAKAEARGDAALGKRPEGGGELLHIGLGASGTVL